MHLQGDNADGFPREDIAGIYRNGAPRKSKWMDPVRSGTPPQSARTRVVFPDPFGPRMAQCSSDRIFQKLSSRMSRLGRRTVI